jgi:hypothetical protein
MREVLQMGLEEQVTTVPKKRLLETLKLNREKHQRDYEESLAGYKTLAAERLEKLKAQAMKDLKKNFDALAEKIQTADFTDPEERLPNTVTLLSAMSFHLKVPENHSRAYDVAIAQAEWETKDTIELTQRQFQCFVLDDWDWREEFQHINKAYSIANNR